LSKSNSPDVASLHPLLSRQAHPPRTILASLACSRNPPFRLAIGYGPLALRGQTLFSTFLSTPENEEARHLSPAIRFALRVVITSVLLLPFSFLFPTKVSFVKAPCPPVDRERLSYDLTLPFRLTPAPCRPDQPEVHTTTIPL